MLVLCPQYKCWTMVPKAVVGSHWHNNEKKGFFRAQGSSFGSRTLAFGYSDPGSNPGRGVKFSSFVNTRQYKLLIIVLLGD